MLRIRVFVQPTDSADQKMIWDDQLKTRHEEKTLQEYRELSWDTRLFGERMEMKFSNGSGRGCSVEGPFMGAGITAIEDGHQIDLTFAGDRYRFW